MSRDEARAVVAELRRHAKSSEEHVRSFTGMGTEDTHDTPVLVVDRAGWVRANVAGFRELLKPLLDKMQDKRSGSPGGAMLGAVGGKVTGVELGMLLSFLASRVLGQYETFAPATRDLPAGANGGGRLLLVAPNIVQVERELDVDPHDFRLWVCLHEETHRTQFTAVPWLRDHLEGEIQAFLGETEVDPMTVLERVREAAQTFAGGRGESEDDTAAEGGRSIVELVQTPAQREILGRLTAVMSLLEGHADFVMDGVGTRRGALRRGDPGEVQGAQGARREPPRPGAAQAPRPRRETAPVPRRRALRAGGRGGRRHGGLQPRVDLAEHTAHQGGDRETRGVGSAGAP
ncbi:hypothetical protein SALBM135S_06316 [Streptomyces alboniger]